MKLSAKIRALSALLCIVCIVGVLPVCTSDAASTSSEIQALEQKIAETEKKKKEYEEKIKELNKTTANAMQTKTTYEEQINVMAQKIASTKDLIAQYDVLIAETQEGIAGKNDEIDAKFEEFLERLRISYENGFINYLVLMFESESLTDFLKNTERTADILEYDRSLMDSLEREKLDLEQSKQQLEQARAAQQQAQKSLEAEQAELEKKKKEVNAYIDELNKDTAKMESMRDEAIKADKELNARLEQALAALAEKEVVQHPVTGGVLIWPVSVNYNSISSPYGSRTLYGRPDFHYGIDIPAPAGSNVYAAQAGVVEYAEWHYSYGNFVVINHGGGYATLYAHNTSLNVKIGQTVAQGDVIAFVGTTGSSYGNHCHFEVRHNGAHTNPLNYVKQP